MKKFLYILFICFVFQTTLFAKSTNKDTDYSKDSNSSINFGLETTMGISGPVVFYTYNNFEFGLNCSFFWLMEESLFLPGCYIARNTNPYDKGLVFKIGCFYNSFVDSIFDKEYGYHTNFIGLMLSLGYQFDMGLSLSANYKHPVILFNKDGITPCFLWSFLVTPFLSTISINYRITF